MSVGEIFFGKDTMIYELNPCSEIVLSQRKGALFPNFEIGNHDKFTVPTCIECGCPDLIDRYPEFWECMSCGYQYVNAILTTPEMATKWRPKEQAGLADWFLG
jgi:ribosomal protein L37AE/L43A